MKETLAASLTAGAAFAFAEEPTNSIDLTIDHVSRQVWNGVMLHDAPTWRTGVEGTLDLGKGYFALFTYGENDGEGLDDGEYGLRDISAIAYKELGPVGLSAGAGRFEWRDFPEKNVDASTTELYGEVSLPAIPGTPSLTISNDLKSGWHARLNAGTALSITDKITLELGAAVDWGDKYNDDPSFGDGLTGFRHAIGSVGLTAALADVEIGEARFRLDAKAGYNTHVPLANGYDRIDEGSFKVTGGLRW